MLFSILVSASPIPRCYSCDLHGSVGRPKHIRIMAGALEGETFIGKKAQEFRGLLKIKYPMEHGVVTDWDDMERIWNYVYSEELQTLSEEVLFHCTHFI
jgi:centractin